MKDAVWCSDELSDLANEYCHQMHWEDKQSQRPDDEELGALLEKRMESVVWRVLESFKEAKLEAVINTSGECFLVLFVRLCHLVVVYHRCLAASDVHALQAIILSCPCPCTPESLHCSSFVNPDHQRAASSWLTTCEFATLPLVLVELCVSLIDRTSHH